MNSNLDYRAAPRLCSNEVDSVEARAGDQAATPSDFENSAPGNAWMPRSGGTDRLLGQFPGLRRQLPGLST